MPTSAVWEKLASTNLVSWNTVWFYNLKKTYYEAFFKVTTRLASEIVLELDLGGSN
jgi:hypothetical protein